MDSSQYTGDYAGVWKAGWVGTGGKCREMVRTKGGPLRLSRRKAFEEDRFRPMYPGFPVEVCGVEQLHAAFF